MRRSARSGFTLLETVVALAILAMALMAIFNLNSGAISMHGYTKRLTVASLLARGKMTDIEQKLYDDGFSLDDEEEDGDFSDEGWPNFKWRAKIIAPQTEGLPPEQLLGALFNVPFAGGGDDALGGLGSLFGGAAGGGDKEGAGGLAAAMGPIAGMAQGQFTQMVDQITKSVREVHLTVYWKDGTEVESLDLVTHVVSLGQGGDRNGAGQTGAVSGVPGVPGLPGQQPGGAVNGIAPGGFPPNPANLRQPPIQQLRPPNIPGRPGRPGIQGLQAQ